jgi:hypothetical protein
MSTLLSTPILGGDLTAVSPELMNFSMTGMEMTSLFCDGEQDMEKLLAMLPPPTEATDNVVAMSTGEETWMSSWLKDEPVIPGVF